jgi:hypothetical protein
VNMRGAVALILHDSKQPASHDLIGYDARLLRACR